MKRLWLDRKFSYIFEARPSTNLALFMQTLYNHSISYMDINNPLSCRLGALYCLYCLYETQPFKPFFKIYLSLVLSLYVEMAASIRSATWADVDCKTTETHISVRFWELQRLKALVVDAKGQRIKVVSAVVKRMLEKNSFLFGIVDISEYSKKEKIKELVDVQKACVQKMNEKLFANMDLERYLHMDMDLSNLNPLFWLPFCSSEEASKVVDVQNVEHIADDRPTIGDEVQDIIKEWGDQREVFSQQTASPPCPPIPPGEGNLQREQPMSLPSAEAQELHDDGDELRNTSFMQLLLGNESPQAHGDIQLNPGDGDAGVEEDDTESEFAKELESELFLDF
ncbi:hypothetical protein Cgig2_021234 [Carnegiea gigantea]|uniref:Uncharacterized protein n=1 Tax=Carnegiea gigantea TaxID=171969 RepID=A0A9Q1QQG0_9CARY|nr:hypothetical protein Cgig2_021234 [Carnegiea gigantea]